MSNVKISWGLNIETERMEHIDNVPRGKACQCFCPDCVTPLIARKGQKTKWHFAHSVTVECKGETALHRAAKQILVEEANLNNEINLPPKEETIANKTDLIGIVYTSTAITEEQDSFLMLRGQEEVKLSENILTDVLLYGQDDQTLSVEIYVTHQKSEDDHHKYLLIGQRAIEIDLSELNWDANYETIRNAVLWYAQRKWIYSESIEATKENNIKTLQCFITEKNKRYQQELSNFVLSIKNVSDLEGFAIEWPVISESASAGESWDKYQIEKRIVKIKQLDGNWKQIRKMPCWRCKAIVKNNIIIDLIICLQNSNIQIDTTDPAFLCTAGYEVHDSTLSIIGCKWINIGKWRDKLRVLAEIKLQRKINTIEQSHKKARQFACEFTGLSDEKKIAYLAQKLNISTPSNLGTKKRHWNIKEEIWKYLFLLYKIRRSKNHSVHLQSLATDKWMQSMTDWPYDEESVKKRNIDLWFWFKELEKQGLVRHEGRQWFSIQDED